MSTAAPGKFPLSPVFVVATKRVFLMAEGNCSDLGEARAYVDSVMNSNILKECQTPISGRKRHQSDDVAVTNKKTKSDHDTDRVIAQARRSLYGKTPARRSSSDESSTLTVRSPRCSDMDNITRLIAKLSEDMGSLSWSIHQRIDKLEETLESKLAHKIAYMLDKPVTNKVAKNQERCR